jgi:Pet100
VSWNSNNVTYRASCYTYICLCSGMSCYISFPLTAMFLFSRPEIFKDRVIAARKRYHAPPNPERVSHDERQ